MKYVLILGTRIRCIKKPTTSHIDIAKLLEMGTAELLKVARQFPPTSALQTEQCLNALIAANSATDLNIKQASMLVDNANPKSTALATLPAPLSLLRAECDQLAARHAHQTETMHELEIKWNLCMKEFVPMEWDEVSHT